MKTQSFLRVILVGVFLGFLNACVSTAPSGPGALAGTWTNSLGTVWTIKPDGTFDVLVHGKHHVWGNYTVAGDTMTVVGIGGAVPKGCKGPGVYKFSRPNPNTLTFTLVSDACKVRKHDVPLPWHPKSSPVEASAAVLRPPGVDVGNVNSSITGTINPANLGQGATH